MTQAVEQARPSAKAGVTPVNRAATRACGRSSRVCWAARAIRADLPAPEAPTMTIGSGSSRGR